MHRSVTQFLDDVAQRGSWFGGGCVAAVSAALAAALVEKLVVQPQVARQLRKRRRECLKLAGRDAEVFARVIEAMRRNDQRAFKRALRAATEVPWRVYAHAHAIQRASRIAQRSVKRRFHSDLRCATALAAASATGAQVLIETNLSWLNDTRFTRAMRRRIVALKRRRAA